MTDEELKSFAQVREHAVLKEALEFALESNRQMHKTLGHAVGRGKVYKLLLRKWVYAVVDDPGYSIEALIRDTRDALAGGNGGIDVDD